MGRYNTQVTLVSGSSQQCNDATAYVGYNCQNSITQSQGACVFQLTGSLGGCSTDMCGPGICCLWCVPSGVTSVVIEIWGGGGGGGSAVMCQCCSIGGGGGGGGYSRKTLPVSAGSCYTICVGAGGFGGGNNRLSCNVSAQICCCGSAGGTTYITGAGLTQFCAEGGYGGESRTNYTGVVVSPNGGYVNNVGDINVRGGDGGNAVFTSVCNMYSWGGSSPFGGKRSYISYDCTAAYQDYASTGRYGGVCGFMGNFPGGGGTGGFASCCCIGIASWGGHGAPGAIRIWM